MSPNIILFLVFIVVTGCMLLIAFKIMLVHEFFQYMGIFLTLVAWLAAVTFLLRLIVVITQTPFFMEE
jgi:hypothetical protein